MRPDVVLFDFDFTLADSSPGIQECVRYALDELKQPCPPAEKIEATIGLSLNDAFTLLTGENNPALASRFCQSFHSRADEIMESRTTVYQTVWPLVRSLRAAKIRSGIVTTKLNRRIRNILTVNGLNEFFDVVVGADDVSRTKPDPEGLLLALRQLKVVPNSGLYVGDHVVDAQAARNADLPFVAALTGKHPRQAFEDYPYLAIVDTVGDIPKILGLK